MAIPLSGQQRHTLTAMEHLSAGKDTGTVAAIVKRTYSYLAEHEAEDIVRRAAIAIVNSALLKTAPATDPVSKYIADNPSTPYYVMETLAKWKDKKGRMQYRTIRVQVPKDAIVGQLRQLAKDEVEAVVFANRQNRGEDIEDDSEI